MWRLEGWERGWQAKNQNIYPWITEMEIEMRWGSVSESDCDNNLHVHNFMQIPGTQSVPVDCTIPCRSSTKHLQEFLIKMRKKGPWKISVWLWLDFVWILNSSFILTIHLLLHFSYSFRILSKILETFPWNADFYMVWLLFRIKYFLAGFTGTLLKL